MTTIYVLTAGWYEDVNVQACFSTEDLAEQFIEESGGQSYGPGDDNRPFFEIITCHLDPPARFNHED